MVIFIAALTFASVAMVISGLSWLFLRRTSLASRRLRVTGGVSSPAQVLTQDSMADFAERVARPINRIVPPSLAEADKLQKQLMQAGYFSHRAPLIFHAIQLVGMFGLPAVTGLVLFLTTELTFLYLMLSAMLAFIIGFFLPRYILKRMILGRQERLTWGLADALDLMVVSMEAGLGINAAMVKVSEELEDAHPDISEEFALANVEIRVGRDRSEALRNLADRTGVDDLRNFVTMLIQADRFGTSIGRAVRVYADSLRTKRRQRAEQAAQKASVKLLLPLTCFLFPTLFIIILGPAAIQIMDAFSGGLSK